MVDTADAEKSIQKTSDKAEGLGNKFANGVKTAGKWAAGVATAAVAVGGAMVKAAKGVAEDMDVIDKGAQRMKIGVETYQELAYAAGLCGVEMSTMEKAAKKLEGTDMNLDQALDQIYSLGTAEERSAKAAELFGDAVAYQMTPMLNASADDMKAMKKEAHDLGLVMGEEAVKNGAEMGDMFAKVEASLSALKMSLMAEFMPYIMEILQWVIDNLPEIQKTVKSVMDAIMPIVKPVINAIMTMLPPIMELIQQILDWIMPYLEPIISAITDAVTAFLALMNGDVEGFINGMTSFLSGVASTFLTLGSDLINNLWNGMKNVFSSVQNWFEDKINWLKEKLRIARDSAAEVSNATSGAAGIPYIPYDNYPVLLHRGETVISRQEADEFRNGSGSSGFTLVQNINATPQTPAELAAASAAYLEQARWAV